MAINTHCAAQMKMSLILTDVFPLLLPLLSYLCAGSVLDHLRAERVSREHFSQSVRGGGCFGNASGCGSLPHQGGAPERSEPDVGPELPVPRGHGGPGLPALLRGGAQQLAGHRPEGAAHQSTQDR